ncbi:hypothetical protein, partial [Mycobacterium asiaticum]|uniref:hypothetical protein n=1 Tax=Mycobacterium asiaticum TaxID=1790 RepID=UPI001C12CC28
MRHAGINQLSQQKGATADELRNAFRRGEAQARRIADKNSVKVQAYDSAFQGTACLQAELYSLAVRGNAVLENIENSDQSGEVKVAELTAAIANYQREANVAAASCAGNILRALQQVLDQDITGQSAHQFAEAQGIDPRQLFAQPDSGYIEDQVRSVLIQPGQTANLTSNLATAPEAPKPEVPPHPLCNETSALTGNLGTGLPAHAPMPVNAASTSNRTGNLTSNLGSKANSARLAAPPAALPGRAERGG